MALTRSLARFVAELRYEAIPAGALPFIRNAFADTAGTLVAGRHDAVTRTLRKVLSTATGESRLLLNLGSAHPADAALINATSAHALDYDDAGQRGHISAVVVPALLAQADIIGSNGRSLVTAYAAGYETWAELVRREQDHYHNHSWHPTGVLGPIAAAAACASLRGLDAAQTENALGIAASEAGGLIANFGSMTKPFHAGRAAQAGLLAAHLAEEGFTASAGLLEHAKGFLKGISPAGRVDLESPVEAGTKWKLPAGGLNIKKYPVCFSSHRALDGMLDLLAEQPLQAREVERVVVTTSRRNRSTLRYALPQTALEAKFSMQFSMAAALIAGNAGVAELSDAFVQRPDVQRLMQRVTVEAEDREDPLRPGEAPLDVVEIHSLGGGRRVREVAHARGGPEHPLLPGELFAKFEGCLRFGGLAAPARPLFDALLAIEQLSSTRELYRLADASNP